MSSSEFDQYIKSILLGTSSKAQQIASIAESPVYHSWIPLISEVS